MERDDICQRWLRWYFKNGSKITREKRRKLFTRAVNAMEAQFYRLLRSKRDAMA